MVRDQNIHMAEGLHSRLYHAMRCIGIGKVSLGLLDLYSETLEVGKQRSYARVVCALGLVGIKGRERID